MGRNFGRNISITTQGRSDSSGQSRNSYHEHDDRSNGRGQRVWRKHVSFSEKRGSGSGFIGKRKHRFTHSTSVPVSDDLNDGDSTEIRSGHQAGRARPRGGAIRGRVRSRGRGSSVYIAPGLNYKGRSRDLIGKSWHKVTVSHGAKYQKNDILSLLVSTVPSPFQPICFQKLGPHYVFYVESRDGALSIKNLDRKLTIAQDGVLLSLRVEPSSPPRMEINEVAEDKIKIVMSRRYIASTKALDLRQFHIDNEFLGSEIYAPLNRGSVLNCVIRIVESNIPEVEAIDCSNNRMPTLDHFSTFAIKAPNVKILYLSSNRISCVEELEKCKSWKLIELKLNDNPVTNNYSDSVSYQSAVRKIFPTLKILDGEELKVLITFEDADESSGTLPPCIPKMTVNDQAEALVLQFLKQFISIYDTDDRQALLEAYHDSAIMSMSSAYPGSISFQGTDKLDEYISVSRNLTRVMDKTRRYKMLHHGKLAIVAFIASLPKTTHDLSTFTLDVPLATDRLITFTVSGMFKERSVRNEPVRYFNRVFVVIPQGSGFAIVNEMLYITNPTPDQIKNVSVHQTSSAASPSSSQDTRQMIILQVSQKTGMNPDWSSKCLEQTNWDLNAALMAFEIAKNGGKIPSEAFIII